MIVFCTLSNDTHLDYVAFMTIFNPKTGCNPEPLLCKIGDFEVNRWFIELKSIILVKIHE